MTMSIIDWPTLQANMINIVCHYWLPPFCFVFSLSLSLAPLSICSTFASISTADAVVLCFSSIHSVVGQHHCHLRVCPLGLVFLLYITSPFRTSSPYSSTHTLTRLCVITTLCTLYNSSFTFLIPVMFSWASYRRTAGLYFDLTVNSLKS